MLFGDIVRVLLNTNTTFIYRHAYLVILQERNQGYSGRNTAKRLLLLQNIPHEPPHPPVNSNYILVFALFIQDLTSHLGGLQDGRGVGDINFIWSQEFS